MFMKFAFAALALLAVSACASTPAGPDLTPTSGIPLAATSIVYQGVTFKAGDHVRIKSRAGTFKPADTGYVIQINADPGKTGILLGGVSRGNATEAVQIALVRFDPQVWNDTSSNRSEVQIETFEASIHVSYLEKVEAAK
jgi:hypothetical protein